MCSSDLGGQDTQAFDMDTQLMASNLDSGLRGEPEVLLWDGDSADENLISTGKLLENAAAKERSTEAENAYSMCIACTRFLYICACYMFQHLFACVHLYMHICI